MEAKRFKGATVQIFTTIAREQETSGDLNVDSAVDERSGSLSLEKEEIEIAVEKRSQNQTRSIWQRIREYEMPFDVISACYAAAVAAGGIIGYAKAGSVPSLAAGLLFGSVLGVGTYLTSVNPNNYHLTLGTSAVLSGLMGFRFYKSGKFMPAGLVTVLSLAMVIRFSVRMIANASKTKT
ncbi:hypothetical protein B4U79_00473 [Dinothrombium tinctorium]|uniref:Transmembrane protein 14C-like protein n=1 Tax=Dinothrombium tinctorium TaxID=1965070 RepID=A0A443REM1_9ACAR|nr:hypothetical protein B4U79_00473 [Dinothrombium tinctorium]